MDLSNHDPDFTPVNVMSILKEQAAVVRQESSVTVDIDSPDEAYVLAGDLVDRIFRNLFENAAEYNDGYGRICISVESVDDWISISIRDDSSGIPETERVELFEPPKSGDCGQGMYLTEDVVVLYGGTLDLVKTGQ